MHSFTHCVRLPASCNNVPLHINMFPEISYTEQLLNGVFLCVVGGIDKAGFEASSNGVYDDQKGGVTGSICELNVRVI